MLRDDIQPDATPLPDGYRLEQDTTDSIDTVRVLAADDSVVATGHVVVTDHTAIYDRVVTQEEHRRLGIGRALVAALDQAAVEGGDRKRGVEGKSVSVSVDIGGRSIIKKKKK